MSTSPTRRPIHTKNAFSVEQAKITRIAENKRFEILVKTIPSNALVSIMNIKPKYEDFMVLPHGEYDIRVTKEGYKPYRQRVKFSNQTPHLHVNLAK